MDLLGRRSPDTHVINLSHVGSPPCVLSYVTNDTLFLEFGFSTDLRPVLLANVIIYFDCARVQAITSIALTSRDPVVLPSLQIEIVGFEPSKRLETLTPVIDRFSRFRKRNPTNARFAGDTIITFPLDIHDPRFHLPSRLAWSQADLGGRK